MIAPHQSMLELISEIIESFTVKPVPELEIPGMHATNMVSPTEMRVGFTPWTLWPKDVTMWKHGGEDDSSGQSESPMMGDGGRSSLLICEYAHINMRDRMRCSVTTKHGMKVSQTRRKHAPEPSLDSPLDESLQEESSAESSTKRCSQS